MRRTYLWLGLALLSSPAAAQQAPSETEEPGWTLDLFGRLQLDAVHVERPGGAPAAGFGWSEEVRRARLGAEGMLGGLIEYEVEADFTDDDVVLTDALISYSTGPWKFTLGQHNNFQSLEELTSSRFISFIERAAFTDAFDFDRRVGLSATYSAGSAMLSAGVFSENIESFEGVDEDLPGAETDESEGADARFVYSPEVGGMQLHAGASIHWRNLDRAAGEGTRYRQRPLVHATDVRLVATPELNISEELSYGAEAAMIRGPLHVVGEVHWLKPDVMTGRDPTFFGGYAEAGYYLTGESRAYSEGKFQRTRVLDPVGAGGFGALQVNIRYDRLDLSDANITGGTQDGYLASLIWTPADHFRLSASYARLEYSDAAVPSVGGRDYGIDVFGIRGEFDF